MQIREQVGSKAKEIVVPYEKVLFILDEGEYINTPDPSGEKEQELYAREVLGYAGKPIDKVEEETSSKQ